MLNRGIVSPGDSPGTLHLGGNFTQGSDGTLEIEIASLLSFDQLMVSGTASLGGTLDVILDGYTGHAGDIFTILTSSGLIGNVGTFDLPTLDNGLFFTESRTANNVLLTVNNPANLPDQGSTSVLMAGALAALLGLQFLWLGQMKTRAHAAPFSPIGRTFAGPGSAFATRGTWLSSLVGIGRLAISKHMSE